MSLRVLLRRSNVQKKKAAVGVARAGAGDASADCSYLSGLIAP